MGEEGDDAQVVRLVGLTKIARAPSGAVSIVVPASAFAEPAAAPAERRDPLTGLSDRNWLIRELERRLGARGEPFALLFVDVDGFKGINDGLGHLAGDAALQEVARRLQAVLREGDTVSRFGGDEFVVLAGGIDHAQAIPPLVDRLKRSVAAPIPAAGNACVTISVGAALSCEGHPTTEAMLAAADASMYASKRS